MAAPKTVLTTGQIAARCQVAPRTVSKWFDKGMFPGGYRVPGGSRDRRVPVAGFEAFCRTHGLAHVAGVDVPAAGPAGEVLVAGCERTAVAVGGEFVPTGFELAGRLAGAAAVVLAGHVGRDLPARVRAAGYAGPLVWLAGEDGGETPAGCTGVSWPHDPAAVRRACGLPPGGG